MLKLSGRKFYEKEDMYMVSKHFPHKLLINYKEKRVTLQLLARHHLKHMIQVNIPGPSHTDIMFLPMCCPVKDISLLRRSGQQNKTF